MTSFNLPGPESRSPWNDMSENAARALGAKAVGTSPANALLPTAEFEISSDFLSQYRQGYDRTKELLWPLGNQVFAEFNKSNFMAEDFQYLNEKFDILKRLDFDPQVVVTPMNRSLDFWMNMFKHAKVMGINRRHTFDHDEGILTASGAINDGWNKIIDPMNKTFSIDIITANPVQNLRHTGHDSSGEYSKRLELLTVDIPTNIDPSIEAFLTLQLTRSIKGELPLQGYVWLDKRFSDVNNVPMVPTCYYYPFKKSVYLNANFQDAIANIHPSIQMISKA